MPYTYDPAAPDAMNLVNMLTNVTMDYLKMRQDAKLGVTTLPIGYPEGPVYTPPITTPWYKNPIVVLAGLAVVGYVGYRYMRRAR